MTSTIPRIPATVEHIQYNFCKNYLCSNFGIADIESDRWSRNTIYTLTGGNDSKGDVNIPSLKCRACGEKFPMKSNQGIVEEIKRIKTYLEDKQYFCLNEDCPNSTVPYGTKKAYHLKGKSLSGTKRVQCVLCKKTFSIEPNSTKGQRDTDINYTLFSLLMNKMPLSRIIDHMGISWSVLYRRINFIHKQCQAFSKFQESKFKNMEFNRLYLALDRQEYSVNWAERKDKRNVTLTAISSADNSTGYVFGINPNFDKEQSKVNIENVARINGDYQKTPPFRTFARIWLADDYARSAARAKKRKIGQNLSEDIKNKYEEAELRTDIEQFDNKSNVEKLPDDYGVQIHAEYTMIAHFHFLKELFGSVEKWRFFFEQESGIRGAFMSAFMEEIKSKNADAFYVKIEKNLTVDEKRKLKGKANDKFKEYKIAYPNLTDDEVKLKMLEDEIQACQEIGQFGDKWVHHPFPNMSEANKSICWLTEHDDYDLQHKAWLYNKVSLHTIDNFFMRVRRRISLLERPIHPASNVGRVWNGYGAYNPAMVVKMVEIFRVVHNFIDKGEKDKKTPAMRIGLTDKPFTYQNILDFQ